MCPVPVKVQTNEQTCRETYREASKDIDRQRVIFGACAPLCGMNKHIVKHIVIVN